MGSVAQARSKANRSEEEVSEEAPRPVNWPQVEDKFKANMNRVLSHQRPKPEPEDDSITVGPPRKPRNSRRKPSRKA